MNVNVNTLVYLVLVRNGGVYAGDWGDERRRRECQAP